MRKIKIVHLVNELVLGGASRVVMDLCNLFNGKGYEINVIALSKNNPLVNIKEWPKDISVYSFNYYFEKDYSLRKYFTLYFRQRITRQRGQDIIDCINSIKPDILHCHLQPRELLIASQLNLPGTQFLFTDHLVRIKKNQYSLINAWFLAWIYKKIYSRFHVVAVSKSVFVCHKEYNLVSSKKIHALIENKIDTSKFTSGVKPPSSIRVVYVARLEKRKGQDVLLQAWSKLNTRENVELILVGGGEIESELKSMINVLQPKNPVIFTGVVENVLPYLQSAHMAVFPSLQEGLPLALLEKMSCGLPVIASNIQELREIIVDSKTGLFFNAGDADDLRDKLDLLLVNPDLRAKLGSEARKFVVDNYDISGLKEEYERVYTEILSVH